MSSKTDLRPGMVLIVSGGMVICVSVGRLTADGVLDPPRLSCALFNGAVAAGLLFWGWSRLRGAKAERPDLTWWQFLHGDLVLLGVGGVLVAAVLAIPPEQREALWRSLLDAIEVLNSARGRP